MRVPVILLAAAAIALSACSGASPTVAPSQSAPPSVAAPSDTVAPTAAPSASSADASTPALTGPFTAAGVTHYVDPAATAVNPADFETTVPSSSGAFYVVFALKPGTAGTVTLTVTRGGQPAAAPLSLDYKTSDSWGDFKMNFPSGDRTGDYVATITFVPSGESVTLPFNVG